MTKKLLLIIIFSFSLVGVIIVFCLFDWVRSNRTSALDFNDCLKSGFIVTEKIPRECKDGFGKTFIEDLGNILEKNDLIKLATPLPNSNNSSPLVITGKARGFWFFEGSFPVKLKSLEGKVLASTVATAEGEWMTEDFVEFKADIYFNVSAPTKVIIELDKDNPSGLSELEDSIMIPIVIIPVESTPTISI
ncbi:MAG: Gmad2 immunoglobulin-like domain-containing protein [bacterium]